MASSVRAAPSGVDGTVDATVAALVDAVRGGAARPVVAAVPSTAGYGDGDDPWMDEVLDRLERDEGARAETHARLAQRYPMRDAHRLVHNHTAGLWDAWRRGLRAGDLFDAHDPSPAGAVPTGATASLLLRPRIVVAPSLCTRAEADAVRRIATRRGAAWEAAVPRLCFQHADVVRHPSLAAEAWAWRRGGRGCVAPEVARHAAPRLAVSRSVFVYRHQEALLDRLATRIERRLGLRDAHGHPWQILTYDAGARYAVHTDCEARVGVAAPGARMATVLVYLTDGFDDGETDFVARGLRLRPDVGGAVAFVNYDDAGRCDPEAAHRARATRGGSKVVLQRWYAYAEQPWLAARPPRPSTVSAEDGFRATISCDYTAPDDDDGATLSCRRYTAHNVFAHED